LGVTNKAAEKGYAFIYFETEKGWDAALNAKTPFKIGEQAVKVQKRKEKPKFKKFIKKDGKDGKDFKPFVKKEGEKFEKFKKDVKKELKEKK